jgi:5-methylcytosine-specific restriction endonuclease McrA
VNLVLLCLACSDGRTGSSTPVLSKPSLRERVRRVNNARTGAAKLTAACRRRLIASRGGRCETCGATSAERQLDVHHVTGLLRGGDDSDANLMVLCFACHHHLQPCAAGCGGWAKKPATVCRHCRTLRRLEELLPGVSRDEIRARYRGA